MNDRLFTLRIDTHQVAETMAEVQRLRGGLNNRKNFHARLATSATEMTRGYLRGLNRHTTANSLGAKPTQHHAKVARQLEAASTEDAAIIRIPRSSGLSRAFHDVTIRPGSGKTYLTIPVDKRTYGRRAREFSPGVLQFAFSVKMKTPVLVFADGSGVAYVLRSETFQLQDRSLLPSTKAYRTWARNEARRYINDLLAGKETGQ